jgi:hypothetical protein
VEEDSEPEDEGRVKISLRKDFTNAFGDTPLSSLVLATNGVILLYGDVAPGDDPALCCGEDAISVDFDACRFDCV